MKLRLEPRSLRYCVPPNRPRFQEGQTINPPVDRTGHKPPETLEIESDQTIDVRTLSTGLLRQLAAELQQNEARDRLPLTPGAAAHERPED